MAKNDTFEAVHDSKHPTKKKKEGSTADDAIGAIDEQDWKKVMSSQSLLCDRFSTLLEQINFDRDQIVKLLPYHVLVPKDLGCDHLLECAQGVKFLIFFSYVLVPKQLAVKIHFIHHLVNFTIW